MMTEKIEKIFRGTDTIIGEEELRLALKEGKTLRVKAGFDPTAPDIHLGHTVLIQKLKDFQDAGHHIILIIGDFTASIGDPTGKNETRPPLTREEIQENSKTYQEQVFKILDKDKTEIVYNGQWLEKLTSSEMISISAKYNVARMLERDDFSKRYKEGRSISIHEFLYPLMQGYDSVAVKSDIELGGTDQFFNLLVGRHLQKEYNQKPQMVLTMPLLEGLDGVQKMSKSLNNYIGITESAIDIYGKIMSISDNHMIRFYELLSNVDEKTFAEVSDGIIHPKTAKENLSLEITERFTSKEEALRAKEHFKNVIGKKEIPKEEDMEESVIDKEGKDNFWLAAIIVQTGLRKSNGEAMRAIEQGGVKIDGEKFSDKKGEVPTNKNVVLQVGKKDFRRIRFK